MPGLLKAMGLSWWKQLVVQYVTEDLRLGRQGAVVTKDVHMSLDVKQTWARAMAKMHSLHYNHEFPIGREPVRFEDDCKGFGECEATAAMVGAQEMTITWALAQGELVSRHVARRDTLHVHLTFTDKKTGQKTTGFKKYERVAPETCKNP